MGRHPNFGVMAGLVPAIYVLLGSVTSCRVAEEDVDGRDEHGHDEIYWLNAAAFSASVRTRMYPALKYGWAPYQMRPLASATMSRVPRSP